MTCETGLC